MFPRWMVRVYESMLLKYLEVSGGPPGCTGFRTAKVNGGKFLSYASKTRIDALSDGILLFKSHLARVRLSITCRNHSE